MKEKKLLIHLIFEYRGKEYYVRDDHSEYGDDEISDYWWTEGNGSCDCNRSIYIQRSKKDFPCMKCGERIKLIQIQWEGDWKSNEYGENMESLNRKYMREEKVA